MKLTLPLEKIVHLDFDTQIQMNLGLARMQEFSDSDKFRGRQFTFEQLIEHWAEREGKFDYLDTVDGIGFPGTNLDPFYNGEFDPLMQRESEALLRLQDVNWKGSYVIGTYRPDEFEHELAHGMFHMIPEYKNHVKRVLRTMSKPNRKISEDFLKGEGYSRSVWTTEKNSYLIDGDNRMPDCPQRGKLIKLFKEFR